MVTGRSARRRANDLGGREWTRFSISIWSDLRKTPEEMRLQHPAMFPEALAERVIRCFTTAERRVVLDPFCGSGSALLAACRLGGRGIGFEVCPEYAALARSRLEAAGFPETAWHVYPEDARALRERLEPGSVHLCVTSPPYWSILARKRTADYRDIRDYAPAEGDLSRIPDYEGFVEALGRVFEGVCAALAPGGYCVVDVMDLRRGARFYPFHSDLARRLSENGPFELDDVIIWDRRAEYNCLRPLGYPAVFRVNKVHEYLLVFRKPAELSRGA